LLYENEMINKINKRPLHLLFLNSTGIIHTFIRLVDGKKQKDRQREIQYIMLQCGICRHLGKERGESRSCCKAIHKDNPMSGQQCCLSLS